MDRNGQHSVAEVPYQPSAGTPPGAEVLGFPALLTRAQRHGVAPYSPKRLAFHELIAVRSGVLRCSVDFTEHELTAGDWLWVRPGQIQQYRSDLGAAEGTLVLFQPGFLDTPTADVARVDRPVWSFARIPEPEGERLRGILDLLEGEYRRSEGTPPDVHVEVVRHLLAVLLLRLAHAYGGEENAEAANDAFRRFQQAVERGFPGCRRVEAYAARLGYSPRTLTRATRAATGRSAKRFIDDRVLLEAKRLLVHTSLSATAIGERLGFSSATVFTKFFRQREGETPAAFRVRATAATP
ncbi:helix-turn-helix transcriptional regulator [Streptomyces sp. NBC_01497]|uniref:helix-turn-helix transcriptional regulator n=1 Tax=Streptomyces sp. NBC_01497 TaxID=2903885 RepID=UPI002E35FC38|nr:AraC family transcriptional regulator [Streptomyces sp. NBC_01497]